MSFKAKLSLAAMCMLASGVASAVPVGNGTLAINGSIGTATCTVSPSKASMNLTQLTPQAINDAGHFDVLASDTMSFDFTDCGAIGNDVTIQLTKDVGASDGAGGASAQRRAGFTFDNGAASADAPIHYQISNNGNPLFLNGTANTIDVSTVADKSSFSIPVTLNILKTGTQKNANDYAGNYSANPTWAIEYP